MSALTRTSDHRARRCGPHVQGITALWFLGDAPYQERRAGLQDVSFAGWRQARSMRAHRATRAERQDRNYLAAMMRARAVKAMQLSAAAIQLIVGEEKQARYEPDKTTMRSLRRAPSAPLNRIPAHVTVH